MNHLEKQEVCIKCQACCKQVHIRIRSYEEYSFLQTRGLDVRTYYGPMRTQLYWLILPQTCKWLKDDGCSIYKFRPHSCRVYDGRKDPFLKDICKWNEEGE